MRRIALIPAYEPDEHLLQVLRGLCGADFVRIVIDDGSGTRWHSLFEQVPRDTIVLTHEHNRGKGCALKTGLNYIREHYEDAVVVTMDADGQHTVPDAVRCAEEAERSPDSLVLGCRAFSGKVPLRSQLGNRITRLVYRVSSGAAVSDTQTGLRAFHTALLPALLEIEGERYEYEMNVLLTCPKRQIPMREVPIETIYENNNACSHFHAVRDSFRIYRNILKFAGSSFIGFLTDYSLYSILVTASAPLGAVSVPLSNVFARLVSASVNFLINKRFVFHNKASVMRTGMQYFLLAACILCGNTILIDFLVNGLSVNKFAAKLATEVTFFTLSWVFQRFVIFGRKEREHEQI